MHIVTNPGSNLSDAEVARLGITLLPQQIVVDGVHHDTREPIDAATVDSWVKTAKVHPYVLGSSAAECADTCRRLLKSDRGVVIITTSRKIIGTHTAAMAAARSLVGQDRAIRIDVVDTMTTDLAAGLVVLQAAEAARAGVSQGEVTALAERLAASCRMVVHLESLDYVVRGGRASFLKAWLADLMKVTPLLSFEDGELRTVGRVARGRDPVEAVATAMGERIGSHRGVAAAVVHGDNPGAAERLAAKARQMWPVVRVIVRPLSPSIYLHAGRGAVGLALMPLD